MGNIDENTNGIGLPEVYELDEPYEINTDTDFFKFREFAMSRVFHLAAPEYEIISFTIFDNFSDAPAYYVFQATVGNEKTTILKDFAIFINEDYYVYKGKERMHLEARKVEIKAMLQIDPQYVRDYFDLLMLHDPSVAGREEEIMNQIFN